MSLFLSITYLGYMPVIESIRCCLTCILVTTHKLSVYSILTHGLGRPFGCLNLIGIAIRLVHPTFRVIK